ncbi:ADP-ribosylation factor, putative [Plasmodium vinckei vinckei]|uniref:ADP-ribosylation factor, putative n=1 Tax=Plasmodium vinckei vinckei TaxID=54757 RepID=A0A449BVH2_PLAVN|nr:ADP-ribosylation factor, putative [Plasmodium vinckei vinckei]VEV57486.1 ADP-ribosylation factor, putative [Plasmodium vinckei vinckei]
MGNTATNTVIKNTNPDTKKYNILILGLNGSGKTTLLYHNIIPEWSNITSSMEPTISYHYEEMRNIWQLIYRNIMANAVLYVINIMDISDEAVTENNSLISLLLNDECLQTSCIVLVFNTFNEVDKIDETTKNELLIRYKIKDLIDNYGNRIHHIFLDCKSCKLDKNWMNLMHQISYYF